MNKLALCVLLALTACNHAHVRTTESYLGPPMTPPERIYVAYFSITPDQVRLDQGIGARLKRAAEDQPPSGLELQAARDTQAALAAHIVERLRKYGLPATIGDGRIGSQNDLLLQGQIVTLDQGNRTRRILIGLGAGRSRIGADTQIYHLTSFAPPRFVAAFEGEADSGRMPGAAETMGAGALAQRAATSAALTGAAHTAGETRHASDTAEARELGNQIAARVAQLAVSQGWIPATALK